ncbi:protein kinase domain-containing protein [Aliikangiella sp. IMCC44653]
MSAIEIPGYKIIRTLGVGGQATVYLAIQKGFDREVALKVMSPALAADPTFGERFIREAKIVAKLSHKSIVTVYDVGESGNFYYLAMEYMPGSDLKAKINSGLKTKECISIIAKVAGALHFAHQKGYIHRDVKSENILFNGDNEPVLTDFGIAKASNSSTQMTQTGKLIGTPEYMSPEQCRGKTVDGRSDLYSLGIILYEMLTRKVPFTGEDSVAVCIQHVTKPIPKLPVRLDHYQWIIDQLLDKDPDKRFQTGKDLALALVEFSRSGKSQSIVPPAQKPVSTQNPTEINTESEVPEIFDDLHTEKRSFNYQTESQDSSASKLPKIVVMSSLVALLAVGVLSKDYWFAETSAWINANIYAFKPLSENASKPSTAAEPQLSKLERKQSDTSVAQNTAEPEQPNVAELLQQADALLQFTPHNIDDFKQALKLVATVKTLQPDNNNANLIYQNILSTSLSEATDLAEKNAFEQAQQWVALVSFEDPNYKLLGATQENIKQMEQAFLEDSDSQAKTQQKIASLLEDAEQALLNRRLSSPAEKNAIYYYQEVLKLDESNQAAQDGLQKVADAYEILIEQAVAERSFSKAKAFQARFNSLSQDKLKQAALRQKIVTGENQYAKLQQQQKEQAALAEAKRKAEQERLAKLNDPMVQMQLLGSLDSAKSFESQGVLVMPEENNALAKYKKVLEIDPTNEEAKTGIARIEATIKTTLTQFIAANDRANAEIWLTKLKLFNSEDTDYDSFAESVANIIEVVPTKEEPESQLDSTGSDANSLDSINQESANSKANSKANGDSGAGQNEDLASPTDNNLPKTSPESKVDTKQQESNDIKAEDKPEARQVELTSEPESKKQQDPPTEVEF